MPPIRPLLLTACLALAPASGWAGNQSSNTSSNCSNGICTRVETLERDGRRRVRVDRWREGREWDAGRDLFPHWFFEAPRRRGRDRDRDDDD